MDLTIGIMIAADVRKTRGNDNKAQARKEENC